MFNKKTVLLLMPFLIIGLSGCATARKKDLERQALKNQISVLEAQIQVKDREISSLRDALDEAGLEKREALAKKALVGEVKSRPKAKDIQLALKNAGYYAGVVDGKIGKATRSAIRAFQKANGLAVDGKVGKQTWALLGNYLYQKVK